MAEEAPRLYLVSPTEVDEAFPDLLEEVLRGIPVACLRLALAQTADEDAWTRAVNLVLPVCHGQDVPLVVTDHFRLVEPLGLDGVHLQGTRTPLREVRKTLGPDRIIGAFAGTSRHDGMVLAEAGADYVSLGPVGDTGALGSQERAEDELFQWWAEMIETPVVAECAVQPGDARRLTDVTDFVVPDPALWQMPDTAVTILRQYVEALA